jgi:3-methyladenine DNA glycosylase AlkC
VGGTGQLFEAWYTRARRDSVIAIFQLVAPEKRDMTAKEAANRLRDLVGDVPDADEIEVIYTFDQNSPEVSYILQHRDRDMLREASRDMQAQLRSYDGVFFVSDSLQGQSDELHMSLRAPRNWA